MSSNAVNDGQVDWTQLAEKLRTIRPDGSECGGSDTACEAISMIIGRSNLHAAVDHYVAQKRGAELVRHILWHLHPWCAMERCYEIYLNAGNREVRVAAVELLRVVADRRVLPWIQGFLEDPDLDIQAWGAGVVDQLLFSGLVEQKDCMDLLSMMSTHPNRAVRERHDLVRAFLTSKEKRA